MIRLLEGAARARPSGDAVVDAGGAVSYAELLERAKRVGGALRRLGVEGFAVVESDAASVLSVLSGAALVGAEPCQYQPDIDAADFDQQAAALGHRLVVSRRGDLHAADQVVAPARLFAADQPEILPADRQPLLVRTTGTTGTPKAARHDWEVLARTVAGLPPSPEERWLLAYGLHQFAGIQVLLHVVASHATLVAPFPRGPREGLAAMVDHEVTCVSATPTYWRFLLAEARARRVKLPELRQVTLGGEASSADLLAEIRAAFPAARISQVYASTELGSVTSVRDGLPGLAVAVLYSESNPTSNVRVENGELWVRPRSGMIGYAGQDDPRSDGEWIPTGDLVEIVADRVLFRGRNSEVINVGGVKVHPLPVEERITALPQVAMARVFGRPNPLTGAIVAAEVVPAPGLSGGDLDQLRTQIAAAVADLPRAWQPRRVAFVESIETRGGKTTRGAT